MRIIWHEMKKIWNLKLLLFLGIFTLLYYNTFISSIGYPNYSSTVKAAEVLVSIMQEKYGFETTYTYDDSYVLEEIRQEQIKKLDKLVQENEVLKLNGITTFEQARQLDDKDNLSQECSDALFEINFKTGEIPAFLKQHIEWLFEDRMVWDPIAGIEDGTELEVAKTHQKSWGLEESSKEVFPVIAKYMSKDIYSMLPHIMENPITSDYVRIGILMLISCFTLIIPYQTRERLAGVNALHATTKTGRYIWHKQYLASMLSCLLMSLLQLSIFAVVLAKVGIMKYYNFPINNTYCNGFYWLDITFGTYFIMLS